MANPHAKPPVSPATQFQPGNAGGGRNPSKRRAGEACWDALFEDWQQNGVQAIIDFRTAAPGAYVQLVASGLPLEKDINIRNGPLLSAEQAADMAEAMIHDAGREDNRSPANSQRSTNPIRHRQPA